MSAPAAGESGSFAFGTRTIAWRVERGRRRLTVALAVDPARGVVLRAPADLPRERIEAIARRKATWIAARLRDLEAQLPRPAPREFVSGETFRYLGRPLRLRVEVDATARAASVTAVDGRLRVRLPSLAAPLRAAATRAALVRWYRRRAGLWLPPRAARLAAKLRLAAPPLWVRSPRLRWGSCDRRGQLRIHWAVLQLSPRLIDYVLAHELVHLAHPRHDAAFWSRLGELRRDVDARRAALRRAGAAAIW